ncbi:Arm DNA-binding domain-containing protein [Massilia sp. CT11-137]|uniref:Arm DNA-binding domain-containing protein n=1 Tax=Massilia sp. CT11-137 TaxID=3393901 RepID=UPI0039B05B86
MAGGIGLLTDKAIKGFIAKSESNKQKKRTDGGGLYLFITRAGNPVWRIKYHLDGKEKTYSPGPYPDISLATARAELEQVKAQLRQHKDPVSERRLRRAEGAAAVTQTFGVVAIEWLARKRKEGGPLHYVKSARAFARDAHASINVRINIVLLPESLHHHPAHRTRSARQQRVLYVHDHIAHYGNKAIAAPSLAPARPACREAFFEHPRQRRTALRQDVDDGF